jgi:hypothetical protein
MAPETVEGLVPSRYRDRHERRAPPACLETRATMVLVLVATEDGEPEDLQQWNRDTVGNRANA